MPIANVGDRIPMNPETPRDRGFRLFACTDFPSDLSLFRFGVDGSLPRVLRLNHKIMRHWTYYSESITHKRTKLCGFEYLNL